MSPMELAVLVVVVQTNRFSPFNTAAEQCGADVICLNCHEVRSLAAGTTDAVKLSRFFDKVIERKYYPRGTENYSSDKRKYTTQYSATSQPMFSSTSAFHKSSASNGVI